MHTRTSVPHVPCIIVLTLSLKILHELFQGQERARRPAQLRLLRRRRDREGAATKRRKRIARSVQQEAEDSIKTD